MELLRSVQSGKIVTVWLEDDTGYTVYSQNFNVETELDKMTKFYRNALALQGIKAFKMPTAELQQTNRINTEL